MSRIENKILIDASAKEVFNLLTDFHRWPEIFSNMVEVSNITETEGQTCIKWIHKIMGLRVRAKAVVVECVSDQRLVLEVKMIAHLNWAWTLEELGSQTQVTSIIEYRIPKWVIPKIAKSLSTEQQYERELNSVLRTIKQLVEARSSEAGDGLAGI